MNLEQAMQAWINASLELAAVMEEQGITRLAPPYQQAAAKTPNSH